MNKINTKTRTKRKSSEPRFRAVGWIAFDPETDTLLTVEEMRDESSETPRDVFRWQIFREHITKSKNGTRICSTTGIEGKEHTAAGARAAALAALRREP